jgi:hypothetical protein
MVPLSGEGAEGLALPWCLISSLVLLYMRISSQPRDSRKNLSSHVSDDWSDEQFDSLF